MCLLQTKTFFFFFFLFRFLSRIKQLAGFFFTIEYYGNRRLCRRINILRVLKTRVPLNTQASRAAVHQSSKRGHVTTGFSFYEHLSHCVFRVALANKSSVNQCERKFTCRFRFACFYNRRFLHQYFKNLAAKREQTK